MAETPAKAKWEREHTTRITVKLNNKADSDILAKLEKVPSKAGYIKKLIRHDIKLDW